MPAIERTPKFRLTLGDWLGWSAFMLVVCTGLWALADQASAGRVMTRAPEGYYGWATDAVLTGQLHLKIAPRSELMTLSNPYSSALNQPYRMIDLSLYAGRYYFYWGLTPVVLFFAPVRLLTGFFPSEALACACFGAGAMGVIGGLMLALRRRYFPATSAALTGLALLTVAIASLLPLLATENNVYGVPIAAAAFCQACLWSFIARALHASKVPLGWAALAGLALGFALGARPNYALWAVVLLWPIAFMWRRFPTKRWIIIGAAGIAPVASVGVMLLLNRLRFGQWTEFGMHYQLTGPAQPDVLFSWKNIWPNLSVYAWNPPHLGRLFPFITTPAAGPFGVFSALPVVLGAGWLWRTKRSQSEDAAGTITVGSIGLAGIGGLLATCAFFGCGGRYQIDYLPAMVTAGSIGLLAWSSASRTSPGKFRSWVTSAVLVASLLVGALLQAQAWGSQGERSLLLERVFNRPVFWVDDWSGRAYGPVSLELELPRGKAGAFEPVLATGAPERGGELVFLSYPDERTVQIGFFQAGTTHWVSAPLETDYQRVHRLEVRMGVLNPPGSHPVFHGVPTPQRVAAEQEVAVIWNGTVVYRATLDFGLRQGEGFVVGKNDFWAGISGPRFTGKVVSVRQTPFTPGAIATVDTRRGPWRLVVKFPKNGSPGRYDPLLVSGVTGAGNFVNVFYPEPGKIAFGHDAWGYGGSTSKSIAVDFDQEHVIEIDHGGLYPPFITGAPAPDSGDRSMQDRLRIRLDGDVVLSASDKTFPAPPETVTAGENRLGGSSSAARFSGELISAERITVEMKAP